MIKVTLFGFDYAFATAITGVFDLFSMAGITWNQIQGIDAAPQFDVTLATLHGQPIRCGNGLQLNAQCAIDRIDQTDLLLVPTISGQIPRTLHDNQAAFDWFRHHARQGADVASNCTGAFLLAEAGLLDGREATTHWGFIDEFRSRYPAVHLTPEKLITADGNLFCAGGGMAWLDLTLYLIERYCGHDIAMACAKAYVIDIGRGSQAAYAAVRSKRYHQDAAVLNVQDYLEDHLHHSIDLAQLAEAFGMSSRTLKRRFKQATQETLSGYLQRLRIEAAKKLLETTQQPLDHIAAQVGYEDVSAFSKRFKQLTGVPPGVYRRAFSRA